MKTRTKRIVIISIICIVVISIIVTIVLVNKNSDSGGGPPSPNPQPNPQPSIWTTSNKDDLRNWLSNSKIDKFICDKSSGLCSSSGVNLFNNINKYILNNYNYDDVKLDVDSYGKNILPPAEKYFPSSILGFKEGYKKDFYNTLQEGYKGAENKNYMTCFQENYSPLDIINLLYINSQNIDECLNKKDNNWTTSQKQDLESWLSNPNIDNMICSQDDGTCNSSGVNVYNALQNNIINKYKYTQVKTDVDAYTNKYKSLPPIEKYFSSSIIGTKGTWNTYFMDSFKNSLKSIGTGELYKCIITKAPKTYSPLEYIQNIYDGTAIQKFANLCN